MAHPLVQPAFQAGGAVSMVMALVHGLVDQGRGTLVRRPGAFGVVRPDLLEYLLDGAADRRPLGSVVKAPLFVLPGPLACLW